MQNAINKHPPVDKSSTEVALLVTFNEDDDDLYQFVDTLETMYDVPLRPKPQPIRTFNPAEDFDLWTNLCILKANILVPQ